MNGERLRALRYTLPVLCGYLFLGTAFGATLAQAGYGPAWALLMSTLIYAGSMQFVMVPLMAAGASLVTVALTALMVNARHLFYGVSFIDRFARMGRLRPYMIFSLTDETYSVFCSMPGGETDGVLLRVSLYDQLYWIAGSLLGSVLARQLPVDLTGIDFSMTALFITIVIDQWKENKEHIPVFCGFFAALLCLFFLGAGRFIIPALLCITVSLMLFRRRIEGAENERKEVPDDAE